MFQFTTSFDDCALELQSADEHADALRNESAEYEHAEDLEQSRQQMVRERMLTVLRTLDHVTSSARQDAERAVFWLGEQLGINPAA